MTRSPIMSEQTPSTTQMSTEIIREIYEYLQRLAKHVDTVIVQNLREYEKFDDRAYQDLDDAEPPPSWVNPKRFADINEFEMAESRSVEELLVPVVIQLIGEFIEQLEDTAESDDELKAVKKDIVKLRGWIEGRYGDDRDFVDLVT